MSLSPEHALADNARARIAKVIELEEAGTCSRDTLATARNDRDRALIALGRHALSRAEASALPVVEGWATDERVLAGCRAVSPALFRGALAHEPGDGPATRRAREETIAGVRKVLAAAMIASAPLARG